MTNRKTIAEACASRIMDRMEMCRGSAILKSDIAREVESAIDEMMAEFDLVEGPTQECAYGVSPARIGADSIVERAMKALGDQAAYDDLNQQLQGFPVPSRWLRLSAEDNEKARRELLLFGQSTISIDENGNSKFVPMREFTIEVAK